MRTSEDTLWLHQSDIASFTQCPESFRRTYGVLPGGDFSEAPVRGESDAALVGTAFHSLVEHDLSNPGVLGGEDLVLWSEHNFGQMLAEFDSEDVPVSFETFGDPEKAGLELRDLVSRWGRSDCRRDWSKRAKSELLLLEHPFDVPFLENRTGRFRDVRLAGTIDVVDLSRNVLADWKTSGRAFTRWERQRWDVQPTVYSYAVAVEGLVKLSPALQTVHFEFVVWVRGSQSTEPAVTSVVRSPGQWGFLVQKVEHMVSMIESDLTVWPLDDTSWHCSPKWCQHWTDCKGQFVGEDWQ